MTSLFHQHRKIESDLTNPTTYLGRYLPFTESNTHAFGELQYPCPGRHAALSFETLLWLSDNEGEYLKESSPHQVTSNVVLLWQLHKPMMSSEEAKETIKKSVATRQLYTSRIQ
jgi:hypothetical protein